MIEYERRLFGLGYGMPLQLNISNIFQKSDILRADTFAAAMTGKKSCCAREL